MSHNHNQPTEYYDLNFAWLVTKVFWSYHVFYLLRSPQNFNKPTKYFRMIRYFK